MQTQNVEHIKEFEDLRLEAYLPTPNDVWTIGYGHTKDVKKGDSISEAEAESLLYEDLQWAEAAVNRLVTVGINQNQFDALVSFVFNIGESQFKNSTLLRKLNAGDYEGAANEFPRWNKQKGKVLRGLVRRRASEMELFLSAYNDGVSSSKDVDGPDPLKSLLRSKEVVAGVVTTGLGISQSIAEVDTETKLILGAITLAVGIFIVLNRLKARKNGQR